MEMILILMVTMALVDGDHHFDGGHWLDLDGDHDFDGGHGLDLDPDLHLDGDYRFDGDQHLDSDHAYGIGKDSADEEANNDGKDDKLQNLKCQDGFPCTSSASFCLHVPITQNLIFQMIVTMTMIMIVPMTGLFCFQLWRTSQRPICEKMGESSQTQTKQVVIVLVVEAGQRC